MERQMVKKLVKSERRLRNALIGSLSPVSRSISSCNYIPFSPYLLYLPSLLSFLFWLDLLLTMACIQSLLHFYSIITILNIRCAWEDFSRAKYKTRNSTCTYVAIFTFHNNNVFFVKTNLMGIYIRAIKN